MTAILPRSVVSDVDQLRTENTILLRLLDTALAAHANSRAEAAQHAAALAAVVDAIVAEEMVKPTNYSIHPYTPAELAQIETLLRNRWATIALNAAKDQS